MKTRVAITILAAFAMLAVACGVSVGSDPTPAPAPTAVPIDLVTADPATDPAAFKASLSPSEAACFDLATSEFASSQDEMQQALAGSPELLGSFSRMESLYGFAAAKCYSESTAQRVYIGQVSRLAGGLGNATLNCMVEHTNNSSITGVFSNDDAVAKDALQADNIMSLVQSVFCLDADERLAFETSLAGDAEGFRPGMIDGLECTIDYQDESGRFVVQDAIAVFSLLTVLDSTDAADSFPPEVRELIGSIFDLIPVMVECGLVTDEDLVETGLTADQLVCAAGALKGPVLSLLETMSRDSDAEMDFGTLASIFSALDRCDIDLNDIEGMDSLMGSGGMLDFGDATPEIELPSINQELSLEDLDQFLTQEQISCLVANVTPDDIQKMIETGEPPANMFAIMATCNITLDQFIQGF